MSKVQYMHEGYIDDRYDTSPFGRDAAFGWWEFRSHIQPRCKGIILRLQDSSTPTGGKHSNFVSFTGRHVRSLVTPIYQQRFEKQTICQKPHASNLNLQPKSQGGFELWWKRKRSHGAMDLFESWVNAHVEVCEWIFAADQSRGYEAVLLGVMGIYWDWVGSVYEMNESRDGCRFYSWNWLLSTVHFLYLAKHFDQTFRYKKLPPAVEMFCQACSPEDIDQIARDGGSRSGNGAQGLQGAPRLKTSCHLLLIYVLLSMIIEI